MMTNNLQHVTIMRKGSILIESIVGISVLVIAMGGIFGMLSRSVAINKNISQKLIATYLAAEGIEVAKSIIDGNTASGRIWNQGIATGNYELAYNSTIPSPIIGDESEDPLLFDGASGFYQYGSGTATPFRRTIRILEINSNEMEIVSEVSWLERGVQKIVSLEDHFFNWR